MTQAVPDCEEEFAERHAGSLSVAERAAGRGVNPPSVFARVYFGPGWESETEMAQRCRCADFSVGVNRFENPDMALEDHLRILVDVKPEIDNLVG